MHSHITTMASPLFPPPLGTIHANPRHPHITLPLTTPAPSPSMMLVPAPDLVPLPPQSLHLPTVAPHARPAPSAGASAPYPPHGTAHTHTQFSYPLIANPPRPFPFPPSPCTRPVRGTRNFPFQHRIVLVQAPLAVMAHPVLVVSVPRTSEQTHPMTQLLNSELSFYVFITSYTVIDLVSFPGR